MEALLCTSTSFSKEVPSSLLPVSVDFDWDADTCFEEGSTMFKFEQGLGSFQLEVHLPENVVVTRSTLMLVVDEEDQQDAALAAAKESLLRISAFPNSFIPTKVESAAVFWNATLSPGFGFGLPLHLPVVDYHARRHCRIVASTLDSDDAGFWVEGPCPLNIQFCIGGVCGSHLILSTSLMRPFPEGCRVYLRADVAYKCLEPPPPAPHYKNLPAQIAWNWESISPDTCSGRHAVVGFSLLNVCGVAIWTGDDDAVENVVLETGEDKVLVPLRRREGTHVFVPVSAGDPGGDLDVLDSLVVHRRCVYSTTCSIVFDVPRASGRVNVAWLKSNMFRQRAVEVDGIRRRSQSLVYGVGYWGHPRVVAVDPVLK
jgi:hypothetical protein